MNPIRISQIENMQYHCEQKSELFRSERISFDVSIIRKAVRKYAILIFRAAFFYTVERGTKTHDMFFFGTNKKITRILRNHAGIMLYSTNL